MVNCLICNRKFKNKKALFNHLRWQNKTIRDNILKKLIIANTGKEKKRGINKGEKNGMWKGNNVTKGALHDYIKYNLKKPKCCTFCNNETTDLDLANISQEYKRELSDWEWLCRNCHMTKDGRIHSRNEKGQFKQRGEII